MQSQHLQIIRGFNRTRQFIHWTNKWIYNKFAPLKGVANICFLQSKPVANVVKATFATIFTETCKYGSKCGLYYVCYRFVQEQTDVCNTFSLCKFDVNPIFLSSVNNILNKEEELPEWLTFGRTILCLKDRSKGNAVDNFRPISCLPLMWKLMTYVVAEVI